MEGTSDTGGAARIWRFVASLPFDSRMVSLAIIGFAKGENAAASLSREYAVREGERDRLGRISRRLAD